MRDVIALVKCNLCGHILTGNGTYANIFLRGNGTYADCLHIYPYVQLYIMEYFR